MKKSYLPDSFIAWVEQHHDKGGDKVRWCVIQSVNVILIIYFSEWDNLHQKMALLPNEHVHHNSFYFFNKKQLGYYTYH